LAILAVAFYQYSIYYLVMVKMGLIKRKDGSALYQFNFAHRLLYLVFSLLLVVGFLFEVKSTTITLSFIVPAVLFLLGLFGFGYQERWLFDPNSKIVEYTIGWFFINRKERFNSDDIESFELSHFIKGFESAALAPARFKRGNRKMVVFSINFHDNTKKDIEIIGKRTSSGMTEKSAQLIAELMNKKLYGDYS
jgi:hypothetical protein